MLSGPSVGSSAPDPYVFPEGTIIGKDAGLNGLTDYKKTESLARLRVGETTAVFICAGQSQFENVGTVAAFTPVNASKCDQLNISDGNVYSAVDPLLGTGIDRATAGACLLTRLADQLITAAKYQRVILIPCAIGATTIADWTGVLYPRITVAFRRAAALSLPVTAVLWMQGEGDNYFGTSQSAYQSGLTTLIGIPRALGFNAPWMIAQTTMSTTPSSPGTAVTSSAVRAAQAAVCNGTDIILGPDCDTLGPSFRQANLVHFTGGTSGGQDTCAGLWKTKIIAAF